MNQNNKMTQPMEKKYIELKRECDSKNFCFEAAISEYIDNSIQSILNDYSEKNNIDEDIITLLETKNGIEKEKIIKELKQYNLTVTLEFKYEKQTSESTTNVATLLIKDNACGIPYDKLIECMQMNKTITREGKRKRNSMNVYGVGMKNASFYTGNNAIIYTKTKNDDFITKGNYNAPLDQQDPKMKESVVMSVERLYNTDEEYIKYINEINSSGTIIKVQAVIGTIFNKFHDLLENNSRPVNNILKTIGMKYSNYLSEDILKIIIKNGKIELPIKANSMKVYEDGAICNPFVIDNFFNDNKERLSKQFVDKFEFQNDLKTKLKQVCSDNPKLNDLYNSNNEFREIFDDCSKPVVFKMDAYLKSKELPFKVTVGIMNRGEQKYSNVNVLAQWRYINLPSFEKSSNSLIKQFNISNDWTDVSNKWSFIEIDLKDLPLNENFEYFNVDHNKTSFIDVKKEQNYGLQDIEKALKEVKKLLTPITDIFKNCGDKVVNSTYGHNEKTADYISKNINVSTNNKDFTFTNPNTNKKTNFMIDDNAIQSDELIRKINEENVAINTKNEILQLGESVSPKFIYVLNLFKNNFNELKKVKNWIKNNQSIFNQAKGWDEIKKLIDNNENEFTFEELLKNG